MLKLRNAARPNFSVKQLLQVEVTESTTLDSQHAAIIASSKVKFVLDSVMNLVNLILRDVIKFRFPGPQYRSLHNQSISRQGTSSMS